MIKTFKYISNKMLMIRLFTNSQEIEKENSKKSKTTQPFEK